MSRMTQTEVIIPTRNAPEILWLTLTHLWASPDHRDLMAVTLLDNRSTAPGVTEVFEEARRRGCRVVRHERNVGVWASVNRGLTLARSPRVLVLTSDVLLAPGTIGILNEILDKAAANLVHLGPWVIEGPEALAQAPALAVSPATIEIEAGCYNGACFLLKWNVLREAVGYFDPNYYVCAGDVDMIERIKLAGLAHATTRGLACIHLDKQVRRRSADVGGDTDMEIRDLAYFHEKWRDHPEILARHPIPDRERWMQLKAGWKEMIVQ